MSKHSDFQVQILEKLGAPLLAAAIDVSTRQKKGDQNTNQQDTDKQHAEYVAALMGKAVQISVGLAASMAIKDTDEGADSIRLALVAVAAPLVAEQYRLTEKIPNDKEIGHLVKALEAVLTFSDTFAPAAGNAARLENIELGIGLSDENQINIQFVNMLVPVVSAVSSFSFGRPENKLVQEITDRLLKRAVTIRESFPDESGSEQFSKWAELSILKALALLYGECHRAEMNKVRTMGETAKAKAAESGGGVLSMDPVWQAFDVRAGMIECIGKTIMPESHAASSGAMPETLAETPSEAPAETPPKTPDKAPLEAVVPVAPVDEFIAEVEEQIESEFAEDAGDSSFNPMGFFKPGGKPPAEDSGEGESEGEVV